jgi:hypothetical protein
MDPKKNECGKARKVDNPYEVWKSGSWYWLVLKKYQSPEKEAANPYARWFCAVYTPMTYGTYNEATNKPEGSCDMGDTYVRDIKGAGAIRIR